MEGWSTGLQPSSGKGSKLIIAHTGSENEFLDGGLLELESKSIEDYHAEMTADVFEEYLQQMIECIPAESIIVLDNTLYHSRLLERLPTNSWKKADILQWIRDKNLKHKDVMLKAEFLKISSRSLLS